MGKRQTVMRTTVPYYNVATGYNTHTMSQVRYTLYIEKEHAFIMTSIVQFLYYSDVILPPTVVVTHYHPRGLVLPAIYDHRANELYESMEGCIQFYEEKSGIPDVYSKAKAFKEQHPFYHIH